MNSISFVCSLSGFGINALFASSEKFLSSGEVEMVLDLLLVADYPHETGMMLFEGVSSVTVFSISLCESQPVQIVLVW